MCFDECSGEIFREGWLGWLIHIYYAKKVTEVSL